MKKCLTIGVLLLTITTLSCGTFESVEQPHKQVKVLILDGQNNHYVWPKSTQMMKHYLQQTGMFAVDIYRYKHLWHIAGYEDYIEQNPLQDDEQYLVFDQPVQDLDFKPNFEQYDVVISNLGWRASSWPKDTQTAFEEYMRNGGGLVVIHAANNAFPEWLEFNKMIGLGGWGGRDQKDGPYVYFDQNGTLIRDDSAGAGGKHGPAHEFTVNIRDLTHPITQGLPASWAHTKDELYEKLRGPAEHMTVLASAESALNVADYQRHEPVLMVVNYHKGRVFHSTLGHDTQAFEGVGFITTFLRGTEWAATGHVTLPIPKDFPTATVANSRTYHPSIPRVFGFFTRY